MSNTKITFLYIHIKFVLKNIWLWIFFKNNLFLVFIIMFFLLKRIAFLFYFSIYYYYLLLKSHVKVTQPKMLESNATHIPKKKNNFGQQNMNEICELVNLIAFFFFCHFWMVCPHYSVLFIFIFQKYF
jgi:hypothetical protein